MTPPWLSLRRRCINDGKNMKKSWIERKKANLCVLLVLITVSLSVIILPDNKSMQNESDLFAVTIRHYGINSKEMERTVAIPLEDSVSQIPGVISIKSLCENNMARLIVNFKSKESGNYNALRDIVQKIYEGLPSSAQRPEIQSYDSSRIPVWSAVVSIDDNKNMPLFDIEKTLKPRLESLKGVGEVFVSGIGIKELVIALDQEKITALGIVPFEIAEYLAKNDFLFPAGNINQGSKEFIITVDGRCNSNELLEMKIPIKEGGFVNLSEIADIGEQERRPEIYTRINGKKAAGISVLSSSDADLGKLSEDINNEIKRLSLPVDFTVTKDLGSEESDALNSVFFAALQGSVLVAIVGYFIGRRKKEISVINYNGIFCALSVPSICLISAGLISISGQTLSIPVLAGLSVGIGTAVDAVIICSAKLKNCNDYTIAQKNIKQLAGPLFAGSLTTIVALLPIILFIKGISGIIALSIALVTFTALIVSLLILPSLLQWGTGKKKPAKNILSKKSKQRKFNRLISKGVILCGNRPALIVLTALTFSAIGFSSLFFMKIDTEGNLSGDSIYAHIEFEGNLMAEEIDLLLTEFGEKLASKNGIINVETAARTGSGSFLIKFDKNIINYLTAKEYSQEINIPGAFLFFPESTSANRNWELKVFGNDDNICKETAREAAYLLNACNIVTERILNFKNERQKLELFPDREKLAALGITFFETADSVRRGVYAPVIYKRISNNSETDVRLRLGSDINIIPTKDQTMNLLAHGSAKNISEITSSVISLESSNIKREDRQRTASITLVTKPLDPRYVKSQVMAILKTMELPLGYTIEFDPDAIKSAEGLIKTYAYFLIALLFCYMILASVNESFFLPLIIIFSILPSIALPIMCFVILGYPFNAATICAFIAISGMTINASVLIADGLYSIIKKERKLNKYIIYSAIRKNIPVLLATTITTIIGALPFMFLKEEANLFIRTMSVVTLAGVGSSCVFAVIFIPAAMLIAKNILIK